jgi:hypothetical protein
LDVAFVFVSGLREPPQLGRTIGAHE